MKLALLATIASALGILYGTVVIATKTPYWWVSVVLGIALFFGLYVGVRAVERAKENESKKDE